MPNSNPIAAPARPGWVYLVGAGPGDPALITVRGRELLATADVVLHDELVDPTALGSCRHDAEIRSVGKRGHDRGTKQARQEAIQDELVQLAQQGKSVVRLKGGDPFLFGRGSEEGLTLSAASLPFEVIPGVCSPLGATAYAGIPLTHRDFTSSVTFVTAITRGGGAFDWAELEGLRGTLCVLMGTRWLDRITRGLMIDAGRAPDTPATLVQWISYPKQRCVEGTLGDIAERAANAQLGSPSLLVVGAVATLRTELSWFEQQPLFGQRVLITRPEHQIATTAELLRRRGAQPVPFPLIAIEAPPDPAAVTKAVHELSSYDLVAFTSDNAVRWWWRALAAAELDARAFGQAIVAAIGPATARGLAQHGIQADIVAETFVAEELGAAILAAMDDATNKRVLLPRALVAREVLPETLRAAGMSVDVVPVYQTVGALPERATQLRELLARREVDVVTLTSSSTVDALCELLGADAAQQLEDVTLASIGPITTRTAEDHGLTVAITADESTSEGLVEALEAHLSPATTAP